MSSLWPLTHLSNSTGVLWVLSTSWLSKYIYVEWIQEIKARRRMTDLSDSSLREATVSVLGRKLERRKPKRKLV